MTLECRVSCAACCIAPSISSPIPGMPHGKPAGVRCAQLTAEDRCALFGKPERPAVCLNLEPTLEMCGRTAREAYAYLSLLEQATTPDATGPDRCDSTSPIRVAPAASRTSSLSFLTLVV